MASKPWGNQIRYGEFEIVGAREKKPRLMGEGSFGKTFEAERQDVVAGSVIKTSAALKVLNPALLSSESKKLQFVQELVALTRFKHPNLIHYIRCGDEGGEVYYAMELCRGGDLSSLVKRYGAVPERVAALIGLQVAAGLREVHQRHRLVHRDIKPSNIMLVDEMEPSLGVQHLARRFEDQDSLCRIVDFGLVDFALNAQDEGSVPLRQRFAGSPMYASPEQVREQPVDGRSDIYSLGLTLWYLVQGKGPLLDAKGAELRDQKEAMRRHTDPGTEHAASFPAHLSEPFRKLLAKMVAKRPEARFASAGELQTALRQYLDETAEQSDVPKFSVTRTTRPLEDVYRLGEEFPSRMGRKCFRAVEATTGHEVKLTVVEDLEGDRVTMDVEEVTDHLSSLAELTWAQDFPEAMLRVSEVIHASDMLAFAEELPEGLPLAEVLRVRSRERRPVSFAEAVVLLRPLAEALDYLIQHGCTRVFLPCEELWVLSNQMAEEATASGPAVLLPFPEWEEPRVHFSMVTMPANDADTSAMASAHHTVSGSVQTAESAAHPISVFARLLYRILNGSEIASAAAYLPTAYVQTAALGAASNNLLRDLVCQMTDRPNVGAVLTEICINEGVIQPARAPSAFNTRTGALRTFATHPPSQQPSTAHAQGTGSAQVSAAGSHAGATRTAGSQAPPPLPFAPPATPAPPVAASARSSSTASPPGATARSTATNFGTQSVGGSSVLGGDTINISGEEICQVVRAAEVISPYDRERRVIKISARQWTPLGKIRCPYTQRGFRLPRKLDPLPAQVISPGVIHSPYADPGQNMKVAWEHWVPGHELICSETGKEIVLPQDLPLPEGILPAGTTGRIMSPYAPGEQFAVSADYWQPGVEVLCPVTGHAFLMPRELPPLEALAELTKPGLLTSPYAPAVSWQITPPDWTVGRRLVCPATHKEVVLPLVVERWVPEVRVADAGQRLVFDPFNPGRTIEIPGASWMPENVIKLPGSERGLRLPGDLPPLDAGIIPGRDDAVRSPYTGDVVLVALEDWLPGKFLRCPRTGVEMVLPDSLPERIPQGMLSTTKRGFAISPFAPDKEFRVPPEQWAGGAVVTCPASGRKFSLPASVPLLEGSVPVGRLGVVMSPFAAKTEITVAIEDWEPGKRLECPATAKHFVLPSDLEEWILDGEWMPMQPGQIRSPLKPHPVVTVPEAGWQAGALIAAPGTSRRFRVPAAIALPSLALEKEALVQALAEPESSDADAATTLARHFPEATAKLVRSIRMRHRLASTEERLRAQETGEALPNEPGYVRSPYGSRPRIVVPPAKWVEPGASIHCTETGRRFLLPANLPPLAATLDPAKPGWIFSPYDASQSFEIEPAEWEPGRLITCALTGHPLRLPAKLTDWKPEAEIASGNDGEVISPFAPDARITVPGTDWIPGKELRCPKTRKAFQLPPSLPPLVAKKLRPGAVESPYTGRSFDVHAEQWFPGAKLECPATHRIFLLPAELPEKQWPGTVERPGVARSPYASHREVVVPPTAWIPGGSVTCPETSRRFTLPAKLPPLPAIVREDAQPGEARSPYVPADDSRGLVKVALRDWLPGFSLTCPVTRQAFLLPDSLPVWEGVGAIHANQPVGTVESPYRAKVWVKVSPLQWLPGGRFQCPETKRFFTLPLELPLFEARVVEAGRGIVASPFVESGHTQTIPEENWRPEAEITCLETGRAFRLPRKLGALKKKAPPPVAKVPDPAELDEKARKAAEKARPVADPGTPAQPGTGGTKRPSIMPWIAGVLAAAIAIGAYVILKPSGETIGGTTTPPGMSDLAKYALEGAALREAFTAGDPAAVTTAYEAWDTRWQALYTDAPDAARQAALLEERRTLLREGGRWDVTEFKKAVAAMESLKKPDTAELWIAEARALDDRALAEEAWRLTLDHAEKSGGPEAALKLAWDAVKESGTTATLSDAKKAGLALAKAALAKHADAASDALLLEILGNPASLTSAELAPLLAKAEKSPDAELRKLAFEKKPGAKPTDPALRSTNLELARKGDSEAQEWLYKNVVATAPVQTALAPGAPAQGLVSDPFALPGATAKPLPVPAAQWKPGARIALLTPVPVFFSLPDEKTLPPLKAQVASLGAAPSEASQWTGRVPNPFGTTPDITVKKSHWYPGAEVPSSDNPLLRVILPEKDFPLLETTKATDVEIARKEFKGEPGNAKLIHPITDQLIEIPWTQWKPGNRITTNAKGETCPPFALRNVTPEELDPQLACIGPVALVPSASDGKDEDKTRRREVPNVKSPYTGKTILVPVEEWRSGGRVRDTSEELTAAGVTLTMLLPAEVVPIPVYKAGDDWTDDVSGEFEYWDELADGGGAWKKVRFKPSGNSDVSDFVAYLSSGKNALMQDGKTYTLRSAMTARTDPRNGPEHGVDPLTGQKLSVPAFKKLGEYLAKLNESGSSPGLRHGISDSAKGFIQRDGVKETINLPPKTPPKTPDQNAGGKPPAQKPPTDPKPPISKPPPPTPPKPPADTPPKPAGTGGPPNGRPVMVGRASLSGFRFEWKDGRWQSKTQLRAQFSSDSERQGDVERWIRASGFPSGSNVYISPKGYIFVTP